MEAAKTAGGLSLRQLPNALYVLFFVCLIAPLYSLFALAPPHIVWREHGPWAASLLVLSYWLIPLGIAATIRFRNVLFLPLFVAECIALGIYGTVYGTPLADELQWIRWLVLGMTATIGLCVSAKDIIVPFYNSHAPEWRRTPRLIANINLQAVLVEGNAAVPIVVEDFSMSGMALSASVSTAADAMKLQRGARITVIAASDKGEVRVPCDVAWIRSEGPLYSFGARAVDPNTMATLVQNFKDKNRGMVLPFWLGRLWINSNFRRALLILWAICIMGAFGIPSMSAPKKSQDKGATGEVTLAPPMP